MEQETIDKSGPAEPKSSRRHQFRRFVIGAVPAAGVTVGLFLTMQAMIGVEGEPTEEVETVHLPIITPQISDPKKPKPDRKPVRPIEAGAPPPILESIPVSYTHLTLPTTPYV